MAKKFLALLIFALCFSGGASAETLHGKARIIDGDSLYVGGREIRLFGIDAPEWGQTCTAKDGKIFHPGKHAVRWLKRYVRGKSLTCDVEERDRYGRKVATCYIKFDDISEMLVRNGLAFAYTRFTDRYNGAQNYAKGKGLGIWQGQCELPYIYRRKNPR